VGFGSGSDSSSAVGGRSVAGSVTTGETGEGAFKEVDGMGESSTRRGAGERLSRFRGGGVTGTSVVGAIGGDTLRREGPGMLVDGPAAGWESWSDNSSSWPRFPSTVESSSGGDGAEGGGVARPESVVDEVASVIITSSPEGNEG
jgi:hypothetical protein